MTFADEDRIRFQQVRAAMIVEPAVPLAEHVRRIEEQAQAVVPPGAAVDPQPTAPTAPAPEGIGLEGYITTGTTTMNTGTYIAQNLRTVFPRREARLIIQEQSRQRNRGQLSEKGTKLLGLVEGAQMFTEVFGVFWKDRYRVSEEARVIIRQWDLGRRIKALVRRGVSPRQLMELIVRVSDPRELRRCLENMRFRGHDGEKMRIRRIPETCAEVMNNPNEYLEWGGGLNVRRTPERGWGLAVLRAVLPQYRKNITGEIGSPSRRIWALLPKEEVVRVVRLWLQGRVWVENFNGRDELSRRRLTYAMLRVRYLPEYPAGEQRGIVDVVEVIPETGEERVGHMEEGQSTTQTGLYNLVRLGKEGALGAMVKAAASMEKEVVELSKKGIQLGSERARQVLVFRVARGTVLWMDKEKRAAQIGASPNMFSWTTSDVRERPLTVIAASTLGYKEGVWGWTTILEGSFVSLVVPDVHWDTMVDFWEQGYILWPQLIEAGGMAGYVRQLPMWNDSIGNHCFGGGNFGVYPMGGSAGTHKKIVRMEIGATEFWEQPRIACMMQDGSFSREAVCSGRIRVHVPRYTFLKRMRTLVGHLKKEVWGQGQPVDVEFAMVTQSVRRLVGMICQYGEGDVSWWQYPICGPYSRMWWWARPTQRAFHTESMGKYPTLSEVMIRINHRGMWGSSVWNPDTLDKHKTLGNERGGWFVGKTLRSLREVWEMGYHPVKIGVSEGGGLVPWEEASDKEKKGVELGKHPVKWKAPARIRGRTLGTKEEIMRIYNEDGRLFTDALPPRCGVIECTRPECNLGDTLNAPTGREEIQWNGVPAEYTQQQQQQ